MNQSTVNTLKLASQILSIILLTGTAAQADVNIIRDKTGISHVYGDNNYEVFYGFGYAMAQDRLFQMEMRKRQALGTVSEVLGRGQKDAKPGTYKANIYFLNDKNKPRQYDYKYIKEQYYQLPYRDRELIEAYTAGVNAMIDKVLADKKDSLPRPFIDYGFLPEKWSPFDTIMTAIDVAGAYSAFTTQGENLKLYEFLREKYPKQCDDIFDQFLWIKDPNTPATMMDQQRGGPDPDQAGAKGCRSSKDPVNGLKLNDSDKIIGKVEYLQNREKEPVRASMAWATGKKASKDNNSIFVSGPQAGWHNPSYYYAIGLHGGDFDMVGFAKDGSILLPVGVSKYFAWGYTAGLSPQIDLYQEVLGNVPGTYKFMGKWHNFDTKTVTIKIRGEKDVRLTIDKTVHGPVIATDAKKGIAYTQKIAWQHTEVPSVVAWLRSVTAHNYEEWLGYAHKTTFNYNWFYSGRNGYVGFAHTGKFPIRKAGQDVRFPSSGTGDYEWQGFASSDKMPAMVTQKKLVNFNNKPNRDWPNSGLYWEQWSEANQTNILIDAIQRKDRLSPQDMWAINRIVSYTDVNASYFIPFIRKALKSVAPDSPEAKAGKLLLKWNRMRTDDNKDGYFDSVGQVIFDAWLPIMVRNTLGNTLEGFSGKRPWLSAGYQTHKPRLEEHPSAATQITYQALLNSVNKAGVKHYYDFFHNKTPDDVIIQSLKEAISALKKTHKGPMETWMKKIVTQVFFPSNVARIPTSSPNAELPGPLYANRGVINLMVAYGKDGNIASAGYVAPPGVSGYIPPNGDTAQNPFYKNQISTYGNFDLLPVYLSKPDVLKNQYGKTITLGKQPADRKANL